MVFDASKENMSRFSSMLRKEGTIFRVELNGGSKPSGLYRPKQSNLSAQTGIRGRNGW